jgi:uncharacterized membrane protein
MDEPPTSHTSSGWTFGKVIGFLLGLVGMVGFGVCTLCGTVFAFDSGDFEIIVLTLAGAVMTVLSAWLLRTVVRKVNEAREQVQERDRNDS